MAFDLGGSLRRLKPEKRTGALVRRPDHELPFADAKQTAGPPLLLDTTVYIDVLKGREPPAVTQLLRIRQIHHSSVALGELTHLFGRLDPSHPGTRTVLAQVKGTVDDMPPHRLAAPSVRAAAEAGIVAGLVARLKGLPADERQPVANDAMLFNQALENGWTLLSRNVSDLDLISQLVPAGRILLYRQLT